MGRIRAITEVGNNGMFVTVSADQRVMVWSSTQSKCLRTISGYPSEIFDIDAVDDTSVVLVYGNIIQVLRVTDGKVLAKSNPFEGEFRSVASLSENTAIAGDTLGSLIKVKWMNGTVSTTVISKRVHRKGVNSISVCNTRKYGSTIAIGSADSDSQLWNVDEMAKLRVYQGHTQPILCATHNDEFFVSGSRDSTIRVYDVNNAKRLTSIEDHNDYIRFLHIIPGTNTLVSCGCSHITLHQLPSGGLLDKFNIGMKISAFTLLKSGRFAVGETYTCKLHIFEVSNFRQWLNPVPRRKFNENSEPYYRLFSNHAYSSGASTGTNPFELSGSILPKNPVGEHQLTVNATPSESSILGTVTHGTEIVDIQPLRRNGGQREHAARYQFKAYSFGKARKQLTIAESAAALNMVLNILNVEKQVTVDEFESAFLKVSSEELQVDEDAFVAVFHSIMVTGFSSTFDEDFISQFFVNKFDTINAGRNLIGIEYATRNLRHFCRELREEYGIYGGAISDADITAQAMTKFDNDRDGKVSRADFVSAALSILRGV